MPSSLGKPLDETLQQAGLISAEQVQLALQEQAQYKYLRFEEILALRGWIKQETADFFSKQWPELLKQKPQQPLGYYLQAAGLLDEHQIKDIIKEQELTGRPFGTLAVFKGWINQTTLDFFLDYLAPSHRSNMMQEYFVGDLIAADESEDLKLLRCRLLDNKECDSFRLLALYQQILQQGEVEANDNKEQLELLDLGLVVKQQSKLVVSNNLYSSVFNQIWVEQELARLRPYGKIMLKLLKLEEKAASPYTVLEEVLLWTGRQPFLTQKLAQIICDSETFIPAGEEAAQVEQLVQSRLIDKWEVQAAYEDLRTIRDGLLANKQCPPFRLLTLYQQILQRGEVAANGSKEQLELINLGLIAQQQNKLKVANRIYESVFNSNWVTQELVKNIQLSASKDTIEVQSQPVALINSLRRSSIINYSQKGIVKRTFFVLIVAALMLAGLNILRLKLKAAQVFQQGNELLNVGEYKNAIARYDEVLNIDANYYQAWTNRGYALANLRLYNKMLESCSAATIIEANAMYAWNCQGEALLNLKQYEEAIAAFDKAIDTSPKDAIFWINKAESLLALQRSDEALAVIDEAIALLELTQEDDRDKTNREFSVALSHKGKALWNKQQYEQALAAYDQSLEYNPDYFPAQRGKGIALKRLGRYAEASTEFDNILINSELTDAQKAETWFYQGLTLCASKRFQQAMDAFEEALRLKPDYKAAAEAKQMVASLARK